MNNSVHFRTFTNPELLYWLYFVNDVIGIALPRESVDQFAVIDLDIFAVELLGLLIHRVVFYRKIPGALWSQDGTAAEVQLPFIGFEHHPFFGNLEQHAGAGSFADGIGSVKVIADGKQQAYGQNQPQGAACNFACFLFDLIELNRHGWFELSWMCGYEAMRRFQLQKS